MECVIRHTRRSNYSIALFVRSKPRKVNKMDEFEKWYSEKYPLPPTIERSSVGLYAKEQARAAWKEKDAKNKRLKEELEAVKQLIGGDGIKTAIMKYNLSKP